MRAQATGTGGSPEPPDGECPRPGPAGLLDDRGVRSGAGGLGPIAKTPREADLAMVNVESAVARPYLRVDRGGKAPAPGVITAGCLRFAPVTSGACTPGVHQPAPCLGQPDRPAVRVL